MSFLRFNSVIRWLTTYARGLCSLCNSAIVLVLRRLPSLRVMLLSALCASLPLTAAILPEDRADALYHRYDGGGVVIDGPSILVRKQVGKHVSLLGNYYVDSITSASHDVVTQGSAYTEFREEFRLGMDLVYENATMNLSIANSEESDYSADTYSFTVSHAMFGDMTTVSLGYTRGHDEVRRNLGGQPDPEFGGKPADHYKYRFGLSQILTSSFIVSANMELITDEGFLRNPYRQVETSKTEPAPGTPLPLPVCLPPSPPVVTPCKQNVFERYPETRTSNAVSLMGKYYLPWRAAVTLEYRTFNDTWDIAGDMYKIGLTQPIKTHWMLDFFYRTYSQNAASFYSEFIANDNQPTLMASDKEMSAMTSSTIGFGVSYEFGERGFWVFDKGSANVNYSRIAFDYEDFTNKIQGDPGYGLPYNFKADVFRFFISMYY